MRTLGEKFVGELGDADPDIVQHWTEVLALLDENDQLRAERDELDDKWHVISHHFRASQAALGRVRALHVEQLSRVLDADGNPDTFCDACGIGPYPCPTIRALDGQLITATDANETRMSSNDDANGEA